MVESHQLEDLSPSRKMTHKQLILHWNMELILTFANKIVGGFDILVPRIAAERETNPHSETLAP
jgi:hypothetical protein